LKANWASTWGVGNAGVAMSLLRGVKILPLKKKQFAWDANWAGKWSAEKGGFLRTWLIVLKEFSINCLKF